MSERQITIRMPRESLSKWLAALRGGVYEQGRGLLHSADKEYCCLGVLQHCLTGAVEEDDGLDRSAALPSVGWLRARNITFITGGATETESPYLPALEAEAHQANDDGATFAQIADAIEACAEGI